MSQRGQYEGFPYVKPMRITEVCESKGRPDSAPDNRNETKSQQDNRINTNNNRRDRLPYQGYPYAHRIVTDAPTLNPSEVAALAKWQNLPKRYYSSRNAGSHQTTTPTKDDEISQVIYTNITEESSNATSTLSSKPDLDPDRPVVYIDIPQGSSGVLETDSPGSSRPWKPDVDLDRPVVYIDIPENNGSGMSQSVEEEEPAYVQDTILYDQFKDRRIELTRDSDSEGSHSSNRSQHANTPNFRPSDASGFASGSSTTPIYNTTYHSKEAGIYSPTLNDEFNLSPLPVTDYPAFPPPYESLEHPQVSPVSEQPQQTQVITSATSPPAPLVLDGRRKLVVCQHCRATVQTVVAEETGWVTHLIGVFFLFVMCPLIFLVYCTNIFNYKNHYCPACNEKIGYQEPSVCCSKDMKYIS